MAQRARSASASESASISTARPRSKRIRSPVTSEPLRSSGFVAATTPSVRSGSGVVNSSSVGRLGMCWMPVRVVARPPSLAKRELGKRPTVRSVPGPTNRRASRPSSSRRDAASQISVIRRSQAPAGSGSSRRQTCPRSRQSASTAAGGSSSGKTTCAHASVGNGEIVHAIERSSIVLQDLLHGREPIAARPCRVEPRQQPRRDERGEADPGCVELAEIEYAAAEPRRHPGERVVGGQLDSHPLHERVEVDDVHVARTALVRAASDPVDERRGFRWRLDRHDLVGLDVRAEPDDQLGVAIEQLLVHATETV